jgi:hypothetical protein
LAIDPGGTTGIALWDAWDQQLYLDQLDAGAGVVAQEWVWAGKVPSWARRKAEVKLEIEDIMAGLDGSVSKVNAGRGRRKGIAGERAVIHDLERGVTNLIELLMLAMGPHGFVVVEDFILGWGDPKAVGGSNREGLSPVRIGARLDDRMEMHGLKNGDAWRTWPGHNWRGVDDRGWTVGGAGVPVLYDRIRAAMHWSMTGRVIPLPGVDSSATDGVWGGKGHKMVWQMPNERLWLPKGKPACVERLKDCGLYIASRPHAMDALMHMVVLCRKIGVEIKGEPKRVWSSQGIARTLDE